MSMLFLAAMMMAQTPAAVPPAAPAAAAKKQKPPQICEYIEITGSRSKRRVCRDDTGHLDLGPGVSNSAFGKTRPNQPAVQTGGPGGSI